MSPLLDVRNLTVTFPSSQGRVAAVRDDSFQIDSGEVLGLVGESGSGKSVTSLAIMRLLVPQAGVTGEIVFDGRDLLTLSPDEMQQVRGERISMIFQEPMTALNPVMRIGDQVAESVLAHTVDGKLVAKQEASQRAVAALKDVGIPEAERRARDYPHQFSGGQRQRVMIAMALVNRPQLLIADEPTTALDVTIQAQILDLLAELREKYRLAMLFISHDLAVVSQVSHRIAVMYAGAIVELGPSAAVFHEPVHPYTKGLLNSVPTLKTDRSRPLRTIDGSVPSIGQLPKGCAFEPRCHWREELCTTALPALVEVSEGHWARCPVLGSARLSQRD
ncbi:MAG TPA: ABC transporter ATP-binding protein [Clostridia bacterium]|nr:ABC transporter ATP-binding protein [Clostridia bacterium]